MTLSLLVCLRQHRLTYCHEFVTVTHFDQASLQFCSECNNLLYPKADPQRRIMVYACRICAYDEINDNKCVYRNDLLTVTKWVCHESSLHLFHRSRYEPEADVICLQRATWSHNGPRLRSYTRMLCPVYDILSQIHIFHAGTLRYSMSTVWPRRVRAKLPKILLLAISAHRPLFSSVFYQDQSKRKETRMILFFVCTRCNHSFMDPTLPTESRIEDGPK